MSGPVTVDRGWSHPAERITSCESETIAGRRSMEPSGVQEWNTSFRPRTESTSGRSDSPALPRDRRQGFADASWAEAGRSWEFVGDTLAEEVGRANDTLGVSRRIVQMH